MSGTTFHAHAVSYGLSLRDASLTILFFSLLTCIPVAYLYVSMPSYALTLQSS